MGRWALHQYGFSECTHLERRLPVQIYSLQLNTFHITPVHTQAKRTFWVPYRSRTKVRLTLLTKPFLRFSGTRDHSTVHHNTPFSFWKKTFKFIKSQGSTAWLQLLLSVLSLNLVKPLLNICSPIGSAALPRPIITRQIHLMGDIMKLYFWPSVESFILNSFRRIK